MTPYHFSHTREGTRSDVKQRSIRSTSPQVLVKSGKGFSLIEMLVYIAVLSLIMTSVLTIIFPISNSYQRLIMAKRLNTSAESALDRMLREIRSASSVNTSASTLGTSPGVLSLNSDAGAREFSVDASSALTVSEGGVAAGKLTGEGVTVSRLVFTRVPGTRSELVSVELALHSRYGHASTTKTFRGSAVLRDSY